MKNHLYKHGFAYRDSRGKRLPAYLSWVNMRQRVKNENNPDYPLYGGRGIIIDEYWDSFTNFYSDMSDPPNGYTLDRIDVNGNYTKLNCRWASRDTQSKNRNYTHSVTYMGMSKTLGDWSKELPIKARALCLYKRIFMYGWDIDRAFNTPVRTYA